jgi:hypothetical protein
MSRTWVKLGAAAKSGDARVVLDEPVTGWRTGDRIIVTGSSTEPSRTFRKRPDGSGPGETEERAIARIDGKELTLDRPLEKAHLGDGEMRCEVANLSRNVVIESASPDGNRGHTMYHSGSRGGISYAEFRHLGKERVLGKYPIHFHKVRDSMRGSSVMARASGILEPMGHGAAPTTSVRDWVGYQSGHGFLEDAMEEQRDRRTPPCRRIVEAFPGRSCPSMPTTGPVSGGRTAGTRSRETSPARTTSTGIGSSSRNRASSIRRFLCAYPPASTSRAT